MGATLPEPDEPQVSETVWQESDRWENGEGQALDARDLLLRLAREMASASDEQVLLQTMVDAALRLVFTADKCVLHLLDETGARLVARVCSKPSPLQGERSGIPADLGIAGRALRDHSTLFVEDAHSDPDFVPLQSGAELRALLVAPLYAEAQALGTLSLSSSQAGAFGPRDAQHLTTLAAQAAVSIRQGQLLRDALALRAQGDAIIASISDGLLLLDGGQRILRANPALRRILELAEDELRLPCALEDTECPERVRELAYAVGTSGQRYETAVELPSGQAATVQVTLSPLALADGTRGEVLVIHDVSAERAAQQAQALFTSQVAHELRTPLQHMMGYLGLINDITDLPRAEYQRFFGQLWEETNHLTRLVEDLVDMARLQTGRFSTYSEKVRCEELVANAVAKLGPQVGKHGLTLTLNAASEPLWALTDPFRIEQVLTNLVGNACKFVPAGGVIQVTVHGTAEHVVVSVADNGPGIAPEALAHVFERFYQVKGGAQRKNSGLGLGLYISREILRALGGEIWAKSVLERGTTFTFRVSRLLE